jgi:hypothetical protein
MKWYSINLVFNIDINDGEDRTQFDEQLRLIEAASSADAFFKGRMLGKEEEEILVNKKGRTVQWKFIDVSEVKMLEMKSGSMLYSKTYIDDNYTEYINSVSRKSQVLQLQDAVLS